MHYVSGVLRPLTASSSSPARPVPSTNQQQHGLDFIIFPSFLT